MASKIEDYGLIGNLKTAALVSNTGSIDWFCAPRFDSEACFASLLGYDEHGRWLIRPTCAVREFRQSYRGNTLVLESTMTCDGGSVRLIDYMPLNQERCDIVRVVEGLEGEISMEMILDARFSYGVNKPWILPIDNGYSFVAGPSAVYLRSSLGNEIKITNYSARAHFTVKKGDRISFQLNSSPSFVACPPALDVAQELKETGDAWERWSSRCKYTGRWREAVLRSLITLKALTYYPTGAIVAAPTTSLPEELGGVRNWDYRFCWLRDTSLTLEALMIGGYVEEAKAFRDWLLRTIAGDPKQTQIMYSILGGRRLTEFELPELPGYEGSKPVRIGNAASEQFQLDIFGETLSAIYLGRKMGIAPRHEAIVPFRELVDYVEHVWQRPDDGIWEVRGGRKHFTYSKVMAWVAIDRSIRGIEEFSVKDAEIRGLLPHLHSLRARIHEEVCARGFHSGVKAFTQSYGSEIMDASALQIAPVGFLPASDPRVQSTVEAVERTLLRDGFVLRYDTKSSVDGLPGSEGAFLACSFWLADNYAHLDRLREAEELFERLLSLRNPLGLLAEEYEPRVRRQVGNFPQGFSHLALITTANSLCLAGWVVKNRSWLGGLLKS